MKITQEEVVDRQTVLNIELEDDDLGPYLDQGYRKVVGRTLIPGFRKGKAPLRLIENHYGRAYILEPILDTMISEVTSSAIDVQELEASGIPDVELLELDPITVKATVPLKPDVELGNYADIRMVEKESEVTEENVQERLDQMRESMATWEPVERPVQLGDLATMKVKGDVDDETIMDTETEFVLEEDNPRPVPGFTEQLVGMEIDNSKEFTITIAEGFEDPSYVGRDAQFKVTISELKERILPELDDEFAKGVGEGFDSLEDLRKDVEEKASDTAKETARQEHREAVVQALLDGSNINLPPVLVDHDANHILRDRMETLARLNIRFEDFLTMSGKGEEEIRDEAQQEALNRLKRTFAITDFATREEIEISDGEIETKLEEILSDVEEGKEAPEVTDDMRDSVRRMLLVEAAIDKLVAIAIDPSPVQEKPETDEDEETEPESEQSENTEDSLEGGTIDDKQA